MSWENLFNLEIIQTKTANLDMLVLAMLQFSLKYNGILVVLHVSHRMFMQLPRDPFLSVLVVVTVM